MKISCIRAADLDTALCMRWRELQAADPALANPYFSVQYTQSVAAVRDDVFVGVVEADGVVQALFPFQRKSAAVGGPVGGRLSDYQGIISGKGFVCDAEKLLRACQLKIWDFDHLLAAQPTFQCFAKSQAESPIVDLSGGFQTYLGQRKAAGSQRLVQLQRKVRKFAREVGDLRFEADSRDPRAFAAIIRWKSEQCRRTGVPDFMSWGWPCAILEKIWDRNTPEFAGILSVLWHEEDIVAAHFGMRSGSVCHWWFPTYNNVYARYSPGGILLLKLAETLAACGVRQIDLGKGEDSYKTAFATASVALMEGSVILPSLVAASRRVRMTADAFLRHSSILHPARVVFRGVRDVWRRRAKRG